MEKSKIELKKDIEDLKNKLDMESQVKKSEVQLNKELKEYNNKLELIIKTQSEIIEKFATKIVRLEMVIKKLSS